MLNMNEVRRIVVKVGSSTLTYDNGKPNIRRIERLVRTISGRRRLSGSAN